MRYDKKIYFVKQGKEVYDPSTGDYIASASSETPKWANVSDMSNERVTFLFGGLTVGAYTIRIQDRYDEKFDYIRIGDKDYNVKDRRLLRNKHVFEVSERL